MKMFKRIYYPIMAVLLTLMMVFGFVDASAGGFTNKVSADFLSNADKHISEIASSNRSSYNPNELSDTSDYIINYLKDYVALVDSKVENGMNQASYKTADSVKIPSMVLQTAIISEDTMKEMDSDVIAVSKEVNNIIVSIPGTNTLSGSNGEVVLMMAHYDSMPQSAGANDNAIAVSTMMETIRAIIEGTTEYTNDLVFVFTDAKEEGSYGAYAFKNQFKGFDDIYSRVKLGGNFDSMGVSGTLSMYQTTKNNSNLTAKYSSINDGAFTSSVLNLLSKGKTSDLSIMGDLPGLSFGCIGGADKHHTALDNIKNIDKGVIKQQADMMNKFVGTFGSSDLNKLTSSSSAVFFSYLDIGTIWYPMFVSFILGGIIIGLMVAIILFNKKHKAFKWGRLGGGVAVQLLTILGTVVVGFVSYFLFALILSAFGVIPVTAIASITYSNIALVIGSIIFSIAFAFMFYILLKRAIGVSASDVVRGNAVIWAVAGAILSFALPSVAYLFSFVAILSLVVMLVSTILKQKFKAKYSMDIERLFLYVWPIVICMPIILPIITIFCAAMPAMMIPVFMGGIVAMFGFIAPYFDYLKPVLDKVMKKMPKRTIRVERVVTERIEDKAKKGKFTEVTGKKVFNEKIEWGYLNRVGIAVIAVVASVMIIFSTAFGGSFSQGITGIPTYENSIYDDSIVYVWDNTTNSSTIEVHDHMAYKYISRAVSGLKWDNEKKAYTKPYTGKTILSHEPGVVASGGVYAFTVYDSSRSQVNVTLSGIKNVAKVTFRGAKGDDVVFEKLDKEDTKTFSLPYGFGNFTMKVTGAETVAITYEEHRMGKEAIAEIDDWRKLIVYYDSDDQVLPFLRGGIVLKYNKTL